MSYMLLIVEPIGQRLTRTEAEGREAYAQMVEFAADLKARGLLAQAESLSAESTATRLKVRDGKATVIDGPYAEAKEMIGGIFLLTCNTREEAIAIAESCPAAAWCSVEVRECAPCYA
ncbi:MAG: dehydrogenase [Betaproteobacteria bacterium]|nr:dehydrogenase [Betaproteobacteria bacterium]